MSTVHDDIEFWVVQNNRSDDYYASWSWCPTQATGLWRRCAPDEIPYGAEFLIMSRGVLWPCRTFFLGDHGGIHSARVIDDEWKFEFCHRHSPYAHEIEMEWRPSDDPEGTKDYDSLGDILEHKPCYQRLSQETLDAFRKSEWKAAAWPYHPRDTGCWENKHCRALFEAEAD